MQLTELTVQPNATHEATVSREPPKNTMDGDRNGLNRIGIIWGENDHWLFWENLSETPSLEDMAAFAYRHPDVTEELRRRGMSPESFACDWSVSMMVENDRKARRREESRRRAKVEMPTVFVLMPGNWIQDCAARAITALLSNATQLSRLDVHVVGWQDDEKQVLEVTMKTRMGARRLMEWIAAQSASGAFEAYAEYCG